MLTFFRKIRLKLISTANIRHYFVYAIGEILLVMIGILLALQVNNWNEERKTKKFEQEILTDIYASLEGNFWQIDVSLQSNTSSINSIDIILKHLEDNLPYHDSLDVHFSQSVAWVSPVFNNPGYESLKAYGRNLVTNGSIRVSLSIYDTGWMERLAQRQEDYFFNTAAPILSQYFENIAMRTETKPFDYDALKNSNEYISVLKTSKANRLDQIYWYTDWKVGFDELEILLVKELHIDS